MTIDENNVETMVVKLSHIDLQIIANGILMENDIIGRDRFSAYDLARTLQQPRTGKFRLVLEVED